MARIQLDYKFLNSYEGAELLASARQVSYTTVANTLLLCYHIKCYCYHRTGNYTNDRNL